MQPGWPGPERGKMNIFVLVIEPFSDLTILLTGFEPGEFNSIKACFYLHKNFIVTGLILSPF